MRDALEEYSGVPGLGKLQPPACIERSRSLLRRVDCGRTAKPDKAEAEGPSPVGGLTPVGAGQSSSPRLRAFAMRRDFLTPSYSTSSLGHHSDLPEAVSPFLVHKHPNVSRETHEYIQGCY